MLLSSFSRVQLCATPETAAHQAPLSLGFSRQEHWSGLPSPSPMAKRKSVIIKWEHSTKRNTQPAVMKHNGVGIREGNGTPLQYSCLENPMVGGAWYAAVHGVARSRTQLSDFTFTFHFHALEKEMATHSSVLAWRIPETGEPGGLPSMGSHRIGHDWSGLGGYGTEVCFYWSLGKLKHVKWWIECLSHSIF